MTIIIIDFITYFVIFEALLIVGYSIGAHVHRLAFTDKPDGSRIEPIEQRVWECLKIVTDGLQDKRRVAWCIKRPFVKLPRGMRGTQYRDDRGVIYTYDRFDEKVVLDSREVNAGDPAGKLEAAARKILARLRECDVAGFVELELPPGIEMTMRVTAHPEMVCLRFMRAYDVGENGFITVLDAVAAVRPKT